MTAAEPTRNRSTWLAWAQGCASPIFLSSVLANLCFQLLNSALEKQQLLVY